MLTRARVLMGVAALVVLAGCARSTSTSAVERRPTAEALQEELSRNRQEFGDNHPLTLQSMTTLARIYADQDQLVKAGELYLEAMNRQRKVLGSEHPNTLHTTMALAKVFAEQGRHEEALAMLREVVDISRRVMGDEHQFTLTAMRDFAHLLMMLGRFDEAEHVIVHVADALRGGFGAEAEYQSALDDLGIIYLNLGRYGDAEPLLMRTLEIRMRTLGRDDAATLEAMHNLADLYERQGRLDEAETLRTEAQRNLEQISSEQDI